ncbi:MAG: S-adenosylmethionine:tRNA ribosyltransferase-isomerase [Bacteroidales bacterium]
MPIPGKISIRDFDYVLPEDRIAQVPLATRDASKLLVSRNTDLIEDEFSSIGNHLPENSLLVFNNTRVIRARLLFRKPTGGQIEIFCLEPISPSHEIQAAFHQKANSTWKCLVGNLKRWKSGTLILNANHEGTVYQMFADLVGSMGDSCFEIAFRWDPPELTFSEILELTGVIPLPPYIGRKAEPADNERYQTIYAAHEGSVAAPTAGLHFTKELLSSLHSKGVETCHVTLHVGIGTFRPVAAEDIRDHVMHNEKIVVPRKTLETLINHHDKPLFAVGTTSARTLESLYWLGVRLIQEGNNIQPIVFQWIPYQQSPAFEIPALQSLEAVIQYLDINQLEEFSGETQLIIVPGYRFKLISGLITNFHMPQSTLLLLVAAMVGDQWKTAYEYAMQHGFRFLSYGDSSLFFNPGKLL